MFATLIPLSPETMGRIHPQAGRSIFWELDAEAASLVQDSGDPAFEKEAWLTTTLLDYGCCGLSLERSTAARAVATVLWCSRDAAPGCAQLPTAPVSEDAEVLTSLFIDPGFAGVGLEAVLLDAAIMQLVDADVPAVEAFGWRQDFFSRADVDELLEGPVGSILRSASEIGLMSVAVLESAGFQVVADHPVLPRLRLELPPQHGLLSVAAVEELLDRAWV
ncbi:hypothetical protein SAMN06295981_0929 [Corynebacterium pollutisoli]|uniref:N-acetyltransferase domain-containing protein n=2 Tax=Corynebacterium pollutisoli TaxID=1610489 RepID=A0A1X7ISZ3_9CORY|nr:hypothetical protein SAMN06295981_0929 [Corynebacterium pollutisoli]